MQRAYLTVAVWDRLMNIIANFPQSLIPYVTCKLHFFQRCINSLFFSFALCLQMRGVSLLLHSWSTSLCYDHEVCLWCVLKGGWLIQQPLFRRQVIPFLVVQSSCCEHWSLVEGPQSHIPLQANLLSCIVSKCMLGAIYIAYIVRGCNSHSSLIN